MGKQAFTPGPWQVGFPDGTGETFITAGDHQALPPDVYPVVVVSGATDDWGVTQGVRNPADARLIASAPELYEALASVEREGRDANADGDVLIPSCVWDSVRAALAQAVSP